MWSGNFSRCWPIAFRWRGEVDSAAVWGCCAFVSSAEGSNTCATEAHALCISHARCLSLRPQEADCIELKHRWQVSDALYVDEETPEIKTSHQSFLWSLMWVAVLKGSRQKCSFSTDFKQIWWAEDELRRWRTDWDCTVRNMQRQLCWEKVSRLQMSRFAIHFLIDRPGILVSF